MNGLAIGFHNLPEGLASFVAMLASPSTGIAMVVAIMLHNVPEVGQSVEAVPFSVGLGSAL